MGGEPILASRWDMPVGIARFLWMVIFSSLPAWVRYALAAVGVALVLHAGIGWLRGRLGATPVEDAPVQETDAGVR
ncbi:hypothetical protein ACFVZH_14645 [Streptomyces sp. NPDC059534]|uniref:hypothetical protein n=1 Tax=Streptomyces sp. NPDC059534 TaxID=3346859 RepID=UPI0036BDCCEE